MNPHALGSTPQSGLTESSRLNCLLYLETTGTTDLPPIDKRFLKFQGNFTDGRLEASWNPESCDFGSFHMTGRNFFNGYLLKKLRVLNRVLEPSMSFVYVKIDDWQKPWVKLYAFLSSRPFSFCNCRRPFSLTEAFTIVTRISKSVIIHEDPKKMGSMTLSKIQIPRHPGPFNLLVGHLKVTIRPDWAVGLATLKAQARVRGPISSPVTEDSSKN